MTIKNYSDEFKAQIVEEVKQVKNASLVARKHNISSKNIYNWVNKSSKNSKSSSTNEIKKLKKELAESQLELMILKDLLKKTYQA